MVWSAAQGISAMSPILGYNPLDFKACCDRCRATDGCATFSFLKRPERVGNWCYLFQQGASLVAVKPSPYVTFVSGERECFGALIKFSRVAVALWVTARRGAVIWVLGYRAARRSGLGLQHPAAGLAAVCIIAVAGAAHG